MAVFQLWGPKRVAVRAKKPGFSALASGQSFRDLRRETFLSLCFPFQGCDALSGSQGDEPGHSCSVGTKDRRPVGTVTLSVEEVER